MPWRQISHLPADQSHKEPTGNSPWPMSCSSYWFLPPNHLHAMLGTSQCWEHRNGENIAEHITLQPGKTRNVDNITTLRIIGIQGHKSDNLSLVYMVTNAMFGITKILHPTLPTSQCREHYRVHSVMPRTLLSSPTKTRNATTAATLRTSPRSQHQHALLVSRAQRALANHPSIKMLLYPAGYFSPFTRHGSTWLNYSLLRRVVQLVNLPTPWAGWARPRGIT